MKKAILLFILTAVLTACTSRPPAGQDEGTAVSFKYARLIHVSERDGCRLVTVDNPWKAGKVLHRYLLVADDAAMPRHTGQEGETIAREGGATAAREEMATAAREEGVTVVRVPLRRSVVFTSVHAALIGELGAEGQVAGVADAKYMKVPYVSEGLASGRLTDCGDGMSPLVEKIIDAEADALLLSPFENSGGYGRLEEVDIPLIECAEYMEQSPLARAEWIRFYGMLYGQEARADSLFHVVDSCYAALCRQAGEASGQPSVLMDKQTGSVWYVPGGRSTIGHMLQDAHCRYPWAHDDHSGSLALPFESVLEQAGEADVWLLRYDAAQPLTMAQLLSEQPGYGQLRPVRRHEVYACNVATSMFYEETPFRPDLLLRDFISILHPDTTNTTPLRYYHKVREK